MWIQHNLKPHTYTRQEMPLFKITRRVIGWGAIAPRVAGIEEGRVAPLAGNGIAGLPCLAGNGIDNGSVVGIQQVGNFKGEGHVGRT